MARIYDAVDLYWSYEGDLDLGDDGDLRDTAYDTLRSVKQEITTVIRSDAQDWRWHPGIGAGVNRFVGEPNTRSTGQAIKNSILNALAYNGLINTGDVKIKVIPISTSIIGLQVKLSYIATRMNSTSLPITLNFLYDYSDNNVYPVTGNYSST